MRAVRIGGLVAVLVAGGCSAAPRESPDSGPPVVVATTSDPIVPATFAPDSPRCPPSATVGAALGMTLGTVEENAMPQSSVSCEYDGMRSGAGTITGVSLSIGRGVDAAQFAQVRESYVGRGLYVTEVAGVGDQAFTTSTAAPGLVVTHLVAVRAGLFVTLSAQASLDQEISLVRAILSG